LQCRSVHPVAQRIFPRPHIEPQYSCSPPPYLQARDSSGWTCLHHALSLQGPSPAAAAWINATFAVPGVAALREAALGDLDSDVAAVSAEAELLELFRGDADAAQVMSAAWK
jgi:hypothetical protein